MIENQTPVAEPYMYTVVSKNVQYLCDLIGISCYDMEGTSPVMLCNI
jgi:hypothetical protein